MNVTGATNINWGINTAPPSILAMETESSTDLRYRDDLQLMTTNIYFGVADGLALVPGTYHVFGNNGTTPYYGSVNSGSNTALNNRLATNGPVFISAAQLYLDLTTASDHLPVVADYTIPITVPAPVLQSVTGTGGTVTFTWSAVVSAVYQLQSRTNLVQDNWSNLGNAITATKHHHVRHRFHRAGPAAVLSSPGAVTLQGDLTAQFAVDFPLMGNILAGWQPGMCQPFPTMT